MPRRGIIRERNENGFILFLQRIKGVLQLFCTNDGHLEDVLSDFKQHLYECYANISLLLLNAYQGILNSMWQNHRKIHWKKKFIPHQNEKNNSSKV